MITPSRTGRVVDFKKNSKSHKIVARRLNFIPTGVQKNDLQIEHMCSINKVTEIDNNKLSENK